MKTLMFASVALTAAVFVSGPGHAAPDDAAAPYKPFRIADQLYYVGANDYASYLIVTKAGLVVIDGGDKPVGPQVVANIRTLGFDPRQVKVLLSTHQHFDHAAGLAEIKRAAAPDVKFYASAKDGAVILGGLTLTAHITAGHTMGCTTWTFPVTVAGKTRQALDFCSASVLSGYKLGKTETYPGQTADYQKTFATLKTLPCEVFVAAHGGFFNMHEKRAKLDAGQADAFVDPAGCKAFFARTEAAFEAELKKQNP